LAALVVAATRRDAVRLVAGALALAAGVAAIACAVAA
jgi:hypothetical protein